MGMKGQPFDPRDHEAFVREIDAAKYHTNLQNLPRGVIPKRRGMSMAQSIAAEGALYQSGIPFWIPPGDGGSNGLSLAADGTFTLSAGAPMSSAFIALVSGGYVYLPAGAGGLVTGGWFWCQMTDNTNGRVYAETYSGVGQPAFVSSPTNLSGLTPGRITQITTEISGPSFTMPGGSMGPNGVIRAWLKWIVTNSAGTKTPTIYLGSQPILRIPISTSSINTLASATRCNMGVENRQIGVRMYSIAGSLDGGSGGTNWSLDVSTIDTSVDQTILVTGQLTANTDSLILVPFLFEVQYGA